MELHLKRYIYFRAYAAWENQNVGEGVRDALFADTRESLMEELSNLPESEREVSNIKKCVEDFYNKFDFKMMTTMYVKGFAKAAAWVKAFF